MSGFFVTAEGYNRDTMRINMVNEIVNLLNSSVYIQNKYLFSLTSRTLINLLNDL